MDDETSHPFLKAFQTPGYTDPILSSSPAFATPVHPLRTGKPQEISKPSILPIQLPPATLRPQAYRIFTERHNLNLTSSALQILASFIGRNCGSGWRQEGLAEKVLDETAKTWKKNGGGGIVSGDGNELNSVLRILETSLIGGKSIPHGGLSRQPSFQFVHPGQVDEALGSNVKVPEVACDKEMRDDPHLSDGDEDITSKDARHWLKVVSAFEHPRLMYNSKTKHFEAAQAQSSFLADALRKTQLFRNRYDLIHQRLLRDDRFQISAVSATRSSSLQRSLSSFATTQEAYRLTPIANLLGRSGSEHLLLGLLVMSPTGNLTISDLTGSIPLDVQHASLDPPDSAWFTPGMIIIANGMYEEDESMSGESLGSSGGVGGSIGGKFIAFSLGGPPCETRDITLGAGGKISREAHNASAGFGWTDFLGLGSERAVGRRMKKLERRLFVDPTDPQHDEARSTVVVMGDIHLDNPRTLQALGSILGTYAAKPSHELPLIFIMMGNFVKSAVMAGGVGGGSIEYKEHFDSLASILSDYPVILQNATFVFVPGDNDPWTSSFTAGAAAPLPRTGVPGLFTSRIKRAFAAANAEISNADGRAPPGEAIWTSNPSRVTLFGSHHEIVIFRDDMVGRLRRNAVCFQSQNSTEDESDGPAPPAADSTDRPPHAETSHSQTAVSDTPMQNSADCTGRSDSLMSEDHRARKLVKTLLDQGYLSPFPLSIRPVLWDHASALHLYPLPTALILMDPEAPTFTVTYQGCHTMNPGPLISRTQRGIAQWIEYDVKTRRGRRKEVRF